MKSGIEMIAEERTRQVEQEGWDARHDDAHNRGEMLAAAHCYVHGAEVAQDHTPTTYLQTLRERLSVVPRKWPWDREWWKPGSRVRMLVKAGALIAAEIDRLQRAGVN